MKKIILVSKEWFPKNSTGIGISSSIHENILKKKKIKLITVSAKDSTKDINLEINGIFDLFLNPIFYLKKIKKILLEFKPDYIFVEAFQTVISELFILLCNNKKTKIIVFSHGVSIFPYSKKFKYYLRTLVYIFYLPILYLCIKKTDYFFTLDKNSYDHRHIDTHIAKKLKKKIVEYHNTSRFENKKFIKKKKNIKKKKIILCIGYLNDIKNQKNLIILAKKLINYDIEIRIVYSFYDRRYLLSIKEYIKKYNLKNIVLIQTKKTIIEREIINSWLLVNVSLTEVMPLSLIEGNNLSKIFLSYEKGSISKIKGGILNKNIDQMIFNIQSLYNNNFFLKKFEIIAKKSYQENLSNKNLSKILNLIK